MTVKYRFIDRTEHPRATQFYADHGWPNREIASDSVLVAEEDSNIIGVVRLAPENGTLVLRGMQIATPRQREGIGKRMLSKLSEKIGTQECFCVPYTHLISFYGTIGFKEINPAIAPMFLQDRLANYLKKDPNMVIMKTGL